MSVSLRRIGASRRMVLERGWRVCASPPVDGPAQPPLADADWVEAPALGTVAAVLRAAGRWSLDPPALPFDATDWWYRLAFDLPDDLDAADAVIGFDGLATRAEAWLNGEPLLSSDNMFLAHERGAQALLRPHGNELLLRFSSLDQALAARRPRPRWRTPMVAHQQLRWWRTTLLGRTPGWSPPCPPVGPWRDIWLEDRRGPSCEVERLVCGAEDGAARLSLRCRLGGVAGLASARVVLQRGEQRLGGDLQRGADGAWQLELSLPEAALWWPHTHGEPALYDARLELVGEAAAPIRLPLGRLGFRRIALQREGDEFALAVNGVPVFCRGACWTPLDPVSLKATPAQYAQALVQCRDAGMNMLRVAGPMVYEDEAFFDACDEAGVLVWQDLMFANMDFPADDPAWLASVEAEVAQQASRWRGRPSVALVCGNSEASQQAAMWGAARELWMPALFGERIAGWIQALLPGVPYWPSSAWGGAFPHQVDAGTVSYYGVGAYLRGEADARRSGLKFATECLGFSNVPEPPALARLPDGAATRVTHAAWKARAPRDLGAGWDFEDVRDHYLAQLFDVDPAKLRYADHERYLALSRVASGEMMARTFAEWRRAGAGCGGALVWWLRDLWAGAGWGLLDDSGQPKACWHLLARALQPCTVLLTDEGNNGLVAHLVNDGPQAVTATLSVAAWRGDVATHPARRGLVLPPRHTEALPLLSLVDHFADLNHSYRFGPLQHDVVVASLQAPDGALIGRAFHFPAGMDLPREADLGLEANALREDERTVRIELSARRFALGLHVDAPGWVADDAYFHLPPGETKTLRLRAAGEPPRAWRCALHALNAAQPANVKTPHAAD